MTKIEFSAVPTPLNPRAPRYLHYRNAASQALNLWVCEIGMGPHPKVWRTAYICLDEEGTFLRLKGWIHKVWDQFFTVFYRPYKPGDGKMIKGQFLTYADAHNFLVKCAEQFGGDA